jgi:hypothetical protein
MTVEVGKPRTTRKSRATGSDIYTTIEVGPPGNYGGIAAEHWVEAHGNFAERTPPKATDSVWFVYGLGEKDRRIRLAGPFTKREAINLAKKEATQNEQHNS